jgi:hypothetical protein
MADPFTELPPQVQTGAREARASGIPGAQGFPAPEVLEGPGSVPLNVQQGNMPPGMAPESQMGVGPGQLGESTPIPQYMGYLQLFQQRYGKMVTPQMKQAAENLWETLNHLFSIGPDINSTTGWHPSAYQYDFGQFVRDVAVVVASRAGGAVKGAARLEQATQPETQKSKPSGGAGSRRQQ